MMATTWQPEDRSGPGALTHPDRTKVPTEARLERLEDAFVDLADFVVEGQRQRFTRSIAGHNAGVKVLAFLKAIQAERD